LTIALAKGRLSELSIELFERIGLDCSKLKEKSRKLIFTDDENKIKFMLVKASDVPTYVEYGAADIGIVGKDTIMEDGRNLYELLDLKFGACRMCVCGWKDSKVPSGFIKVATKYPNITRNYFAQKNQTVEIIKLSGSVELAPLCGLSEFIVDIVESGRTLKENNLSVIEEICSISARMVVNRVSLKMEKERIMDIVEKLRQEVSK
jgi:ATP phosphoribosyltransferase